MHADRAVCDVAAICESLELPRRPSRTWSRSVFRSPIEDILEPRDAVAAVE
jgi:hypothetical protein